MESPNLKAMSVDQLWNLHEELVTELGRKITDEKARLEARLRQIGSPPAEDNGDRARRPYPKVHPKYRNPKNPQETWAGRGKQPRWLVAQLRAGKKLEQFVIRRSSGDRTLLSGWTASSKKTH
jgi:DNA-binding protein H-NS